jgi:hypothetical protein
MHPVPSATVPWARLTRNLAPLAQGEAANDWSVSGRGLSIEQAPHCRPDRRGSERKPLRPLDVSISPVFRR